ncbi:MAG: YitT family protein [Eubacteriaceae bacterium]|jgi:uncharacterized membrane-anchored protein YitT (DUF2179 family)
MKITKREIIDIIWELLGCFLIAVATRCFALEAGFPMAGFTGISMIVYRLTGFPIGLMSLLLNIPVILLCYKMLGRSFMTKTFFCMVAYSIMLDYLTPLIPVYQGGRILAAIACGVLNGIGCAVIYMRGSSTGGFDFITMSIKAMKPYINIGTISFVSSIGIIVAGGLIFHDFDGIILSMIIAFLTSAVIDKVMDTLNAGKIALVVTDHGQSICDVINDCANRGSTILEGRGGYEKGSKQIVMVACSDRELPGIRKAVKDADEGAFMIVMNSSEVRGNGFRMVG